MLSRSRQRGVSMIEISVAMALAAILLFAVAPSVSSMVANSRVRSTAESVQQGIQRARTEALKRNQVVTLWFLTRNSECSLDKSCALSATTKAWVVSLDNPAGACAASASATAAPRLIEKSAGNAAGTNVTLNAWQSGGASAGASNSVSFDSFGRVTAGTAVARVELASASSIDDLRTMRILLSRGGSLQSCEPGVTNTGDPRYCTPLAP